MRCMLRIEILKHLFEKLIQNKEEVEPLISSNKNQLSRQICDVKKSLEIDDEVEKLPFSTIKK